MAYELNVPHIHQDEPTNCWYAAACMLAFYRSPGPRLGLPQVSHGNVSALGPSKFAELAMSEGLQAVSNAGRVWTLAEIESALRKYGPLWCAGKWQKINHVIVITGVGTYTKNRLHSVLKINDPAYPAPREGAIDWFNNNLSKNIAHPMLYKLSATPAPGGPIIGQHR